MSTDAQAVTFDFGQTLAELDHEMLARRAAERGVTLDVRRLVEETDAAWRAYGEAKRSGLVGKDAWCTFMRTLLERAGLRARSARSERSECEGRRDGAPTGELSAGADALAEWLFDEQPTKNLWRKPIPGMFELARELAARGVRVGIVSNSEGRLAELVSELGHGELFSVVADSGRLGFEKPDRRIFDWAAERLGVALVDVVHVGDAWEADVVGALEAGARAIWFSSGDQRVLTERVRRAANADECLAALRAFGVVA